jgi:hypothetical protein
MSDDPRGDYRPDPNLTPDRVRARLARALAQQAAVDNLKTTAAQQRAAKNN